MATLTNTATDFLASLERVPWIPVAEVESILRENGQPCFDAWLEFHEQFAGYVEPIGADIAIWGLIHRKTKWLAPMHAEIDYENDGVTVYIVCADVHPSYDYQLDNHGEFLGFPAERFAVHVERSAAGWLFRSGFQTEVLPQAHLRDPAFMSRFTEANIITSASDKFFNYHQDDDVLTIWQNGAEFPQRAWRRLRSP